MATNNTHEMAANFNTTVENLINLNKTADKSIVNNFKAGDVLACFAGYPYEVICIVELVKDNPDVDNFNDYISDKSYLPMTSHLISANWFKVN